MPSSASGMEPAATRPARPSAASAVVVGAGIVAALYLGRTVLIPVALALLLALLMAPLVKLLQRLLLPPVAAVLLVGVLACGTLGTAAWVIGSQALVLVSELPRYRENIQAKIADVRRLGRGGAIEDLKETVEEATRAVEGTRPADRERAPVPGEVRQDPAAQLWALSGSLGGYLVVQTLINATFGVLVAAGLLLIGLPYALLFGFLAAVFRFIPYVGPWIGALLPVVLGLAVFPGWTRPLLVLALVAALELLTNLVLETVLYAGSVGLSQVALLVAIAFWTALWGPIGLVLATPLTVCLVVLGKYVPELNFFAVLMGDTPVVSPDLACYQRLIADDTDEALEVVEEAARRSPEEAYDTVRVRVLQHARRDRAAGVISAAEEQDVIRRLRDVLEQWDDAGPAPPASPAGAEAAVIGVPARDLADEVALEMLQRLLARRRVVMAVASATRLASERVALVAERRPVVAVVGTVRPRPGARVAAAGPPGCRPGPAGRTLAPSGSPGGIVSLTATRGPGGGRGRAGRAPRGTPARPCAGPPSGRGRTARRRAG